MGRSNRLQADENRMRILEHADEALRSGGISAVSIADVMARAGMTQGGFYNHFPSKAALIAEACASAFERAGQRWKSAAFPRGRPASGAMTRLVTYYLARKPPEQSCPMVALGPDVARDPPASALSTAYQDGVEQLLCTFLDVGHADPCCTLTDEQLRLTFSAMVGTNMLTRATGDTAWPAIMQRILTTPDTR